MADTNYCCGGLCPVSVGLYFISFHCLFHGAFGACLVESSYYNYIFVLINALAVTSSLLYIPTGVLIFWVALSQNWKVANCAGCILCLINSINVSVYFLYMFVYCQFNANSLLDATLFWRNDQDWITSHDLPLTMWHLMSASYILVSGLIWYYTFVICKFAKIQRFGQTT